MAMSTCSAAHIKVPLPALSPIPQPPLDSCNHLPISLSQRRRPSLGPTGNSAKTIALSLLPSCTETTSKSLNHSLDPTVYNPNNARAGTVYDSRASGA